MVKRKGETIEDINTRLKTAKIPVRVLQRGNALSLRATLPPKPGEEHKGRHRQEISLGIPASSEGLKRIEAEAHQLGSLITMGRFDWIAPYLSAKQEEARSLTVSTLVERFKTEYMHTHELTERTWQRHWRTIYQRLPQAAELSPGTILAVILKTEKDTRLRKQACQKLQKLADFAGIEINLQPYQGNYGRGKEQARDIPPDELIKQWFDKIPNPAWKTAYALMACFGLRPHECFFVQWIDTYTIRVREGKTKDRIVRALPPDWVNEWSLSANQPIPKVNGRDYQELGQLSRVNYLVPFSASIFSSFLLQDWTSNRWNRIA